MELGFRLRMRDKIPGESPARDPAYPGEGDEQVGELVAIPAAGEERLIRAQSFLLFFWIFYFCADISIDITDPGGQIIRGEPLFVGDRTDRRGTDGPVREALRVFFLERFGDTRDPPPLMCGHERGLGEDGEFSLEGYDSFRVDFLRIEVERVVSLFF